MGLPCMQPASPEILILPLWIVVFWNDLKPGEKYSEPFSNHVWCIKPCSGAWHLIKLRAELAMWSYSSNSSFHRTIKQVRDLFVCSAGSPLHRAWRGIKQWYPCISKGQGWNIQVWGIPLNHCTINLRREHTVCVSCSLAAHRDEFCRSHVQIQLYTLVRE